MRNYNIFWVFFFFTLSSELFAFEKEIVVVVPSYNNKEWYRKNLESILQQEYSNYTVIYIDDCSPDGTGQLVEEFLQDNDPLHRVTLTKNKVRRGALANHYMAVYMVSDHVIIVHLDGDDWFYHNNVLQRVNQEYQDSEVWMTYGQFVCYPSGTLGHCRKTSPEIVAANSWRDSLLMRWSALRTFYAWLFKNIKKEDLMINNVFFPVACDNAFMFPMLEMAQYHVRFIPDVLYVYNTETPINDYKKNLSLQLSVAHYIQQKQRYKPLAQPLI